MLGCGGREEVLWRGRYVSGEAESRREYRGGVGGVPGVAEAVDGRA